MIIVLTVRGHEYTFASFANGTYGFPAPRVRTMTYEHLFAARRVPRATYAFTDLDRLAPWELRIAADRYRRMGEAGLRCLNNPALAMSRVALLRALHRAGINPFDVYRADEAPQPKRFPVFLRTEDDHWTPKPDLIADQAALDAVLDARRHEGVPLRGILVVEHCPAPYDGTPKVGPPKIGPLWHKWGTFRIGQRMSVDHIGVEDHWYVKHGIWDMLNAEVVADEHDAVKTNRFAADVEKAFVLGNIEFGRADHGTVGGRTVIYEINTNPTVGHYVKDRIAVRAETQTLVRQRLAAMLDEIDCREAGEVALKRCKLFKAERTWRFGTRTILRP